MVADEAAPTGLWLVPVCWAAEIWGKKGGKKKRDLAFVPTRQSGERGMVAGRGRKDKFSRGN